MKIKPNEYQEIANCFLGSTHPSDVAKKLCDVFQKYNPNFDPKRFMKACEGIKNEVHSRV